MVSVFIINLIEYAFGVLFLCMYVELTNIGTTDSRLECEELIKSKHEKYS